MCPKKTNINIAIDLILCVLVLYSSGISKGHRFFVYDKCNNLWRTMNETRETYQLDQFKNLSEEIIRPLNKTSRIKVNL